MSPSDLQKLLDPIASRLGFSHWGIQALEKPSSFEHYRAWLDQHLNGEMKYLEEHAAGKENPALVAPRARSLFVFAFPYGPKDAILGADQFPLKKNRIAQYARGFDYHFFLKEKMATLIQKLQPHFPDEDFLAVTDSFPLMERDFAAKAGLGWFGKNTCLIHPKKGSLFLLCEIITSLDVQVVPEPLPDFCGTCTRCLEACPTGAIESPRVVNATKCISYWTIESRVLPPVELREKFGDWLFGCDICQNVCPWNQKIYKGLLPAENILNHNTDDSKVLEQELEFLLTASGKKISQWVHGTPLARAGSFGLRRNAMIVIANRRLQALRTSVEKFCEDERLGELARWTLEKLSEPHAV